MYIFVNVVTFLLMTFIAKPLIFIYTGTLCFFSWLSKRIVPETELEKYFKVSVYKDRMKVEKDKTKMERKMIRDYQGAYAHWKDKKDIEEIENRPTFEQLAEEQEEKRRRGEI
jgi:predicted nucleotidyltransferase